MKPLVGRRVMVTRPREQAIELLELLESTGAEVVVAPLIRVEPPLDVRPLRDAAARAGDFDWIVLTSANAVDAFMRASASFESATSAGSTRFCAVGPATAARLAAYNIRANVVPDEARAEGVVAALTSAGNLAGTAVLLPRADIGRDYVARELTAAGAAVTDVIAYRTVTETSLPEPTVEMLRRGLIDVVTFTSGSAVAAFVQIFGAEARDVLSQTTVAVIGPTTAQAVTNAGGRVGIQPVQYTAPALVDAIVRHYAK